MKISILLFLLVLPIVSHADEILDQAIRHYQKGEYRKAVELLSPNKKLQDTTSKALFWLAKSYLKNREWDNAVDTMRKSVEMEPSNATYHLWLGRCYGARADNRFPLFAYGDAKHLLEEFKLASELAPKDIGIRFDLMEFYVQAPGIAGGDEEKAWAEAEAIAQLDPAA